MKSFILSHLYYFLYIADELSITNHRICYDLNIFKSDFQISYKFNVKTEFSTAIIDLWKSIYKNALIKDKKRVDKDLNNNTVYNHPFNIVTNLIKRLKPTFTTKLTLGSILSYFLDILLSNSNFKMICNYIHLLLSLN